jgi:hypothetical protein
MKLPNLVPSHINRLGLSYFALGITLTGLTYAAVQQDIRQAANDPQIQLAEDTAAALERGQTPESLATGPEVNMKTSLAPYLIILDADKQVLATTGKLDGKVVVPPAGSFDAAAASTGEDGPAMENRITWEPAKDVRQAAVIVAHKGGYVLAARSLREVENRSYQLAQRITAAFVTLAVVGLVLLVLL